MKKSVFILIILLLVHPVYTQVLKEKTRQQAVYIELLGQSVAYSVKYDRNFFRGDGGLGMSIGLGYLPAVDISNILSVPASINYLIGKNGNYFEIGAGITYIGKVDPGSFSNGYWGALWIGFRHQPVSNGFLFRGGLMPFVVYNQVLTAPPLYPGISFGYAF